MCDKSKQFTKHTQILLATSSDLRGTAFLSPVRPERQASPGSVREAGRPAMQHLSGLHPHPQGGHGHLTRWVFGGCGHI